MKNSFFIVLEGIDGSGKSSLCSYLSQSLMMYKTFFKKKIGVLTTKEPTANSESGIKLFNSFITERFSLEEETNLFVQDRKHHVENVIAPYLNMDIPEGYRILICDRYIYSNMAYQSARGYDIKHITKLNENFPIPDLVLYLDIDVNIAIDRIYKNRVLDTFEQSKSYLEKVKNQYNIIWNNKILHDNVEIINANVHIMNMYKNAENAIDKHIFSVLK